MTSLQMALIYSALVNGGNMAYPVLTLDSEGKSGQVWKSRSMSPAAAEPLANDLVQAVNDPTGYGHGAAVPGMRIAGKTGTAELKQKKGEATFQGNVTG